MWERFSYYGIRPLLVLFMSAALLDGGFGFTRQTASSIVGIYAACVYLASLPGGWIADRWLGLRNADLVRRHPDRVRASAIGLSAIFEHRAFFLGLILIVAGTGLLKPNISAIVGDLYPEGGARRDAGFSIFYMGINVGALVAPLVTGYLGRACRLALTALGRRASACLVGVHLVSPARGRRRSARWACSRRSARPSRPRFGRTRLIGVGLLVAIVVAGMLGLFTVNAIAIAGNMRNVMLGPGCRVLPVSLPVRRPDDG